MNQFPFAAAAEMIGKAKRILVSGHMSPDGDSLGSMLALARMLSAAGHPAVATANAKALGKPGFLAGKGELKPLNRLGRERFDLLIAVDCAAIDRLPPEVRPFAEKLPVLAIDHHVTHSPFAAVTIVDPDASSTAEIIWRFAKWNEWPLTPAIAEALWVAMITDSGRFAYESTRPSTLRAATDLLKYGVRTAFINDLIFGSFTLKEIELKRRVWRSLRVWRDRRVAEATLRSADFRAVGGTRAEAEDAVEVPRSVAHNEIALFFYQLPEKRGETRVSIRTRSPWDATKIAAAFGGGGHVRAAGCTVKAPLTQARAQVRKVVHALLHAADDAQAS